MRLFSYYLNVVPSEYTLLNNTTHSVYQYVKAVSSKDVHLQHNEIPYVQFNYTISGAMLKYQQYEQSFVHFLTQILAIIGGIFTVAGIIDSIIYSSLGKLLEKAELNKLG